MNKPVAWMLTLPDGTHDWILDGNGCEGYIPLYTHPIKELTDEEICKIYTDESLLIVEDDDIDDLIEFARAILRKAQSNCNGFCGEYECKENKEECKRKAQENG